ncbi:hypothetical protein D9M68_695750 [compost metagenome]
MVGAARAERRQRLQVLRCDEVEHGLAAVEMPDLLLVGADQATDDRHQLAGDIGAGGSVEHRLHCATEGRLGVFRLEPGDRLVDDLDRRLIGLPGRVAPGEETMAFKHDAACVGVLQAEFFQPQAKLVTRALPGQPADIVAEGLCRQLAAVVGCGNRDDRVGMHVVDMLLRHIGV